MNVLETFERDIEDYQRSYEKAAQALLAIYDGDLWSEDYASFDAYCEERWQFKKSHAYRLLGEGRLIEHLPPEKRPPNEAMARELLAVKAWEKEGEKYRVDRARTPIKQAEAWEIISTSDPKTAQDVRAELDRHNFKRQKLKKREDAREVERKKLWRAIETIANSELTPEEFLEGKAYANLGPYYATAFAWLEEVNAQADQK